MTALRIPPVGLRWWADRDPGIRGRDLAMCLRRAEGATYQAIADDFGVSPTTVQNAEHRSSAFLLAIVWHTFYGGDPGTSAMRIVDPVHWEDSSE